MRNYSENLGLRFFRTCEYSILCKFELHDSSTLVLFYSVCMSTGVAFIIHPGLLARGKVLLLKPRPPSLSILGVRLKHHHNHHLLAHTLGFLTGLNSSMPSAAGMCKDSGEICVLCMTELI